MHKNSYDQMKRVASHYLDIEAQLDILDVGSFDANGTYRTLFGWSNWRYTGADIVPGPNVDVVIDGDYEWPMFQNGQFDVVVSGQALEHMECPWLAAKSMYRVCKPGGLCTVIVPAVWMYHPAPKDCWRIFADGMRALMVRTAGFVEIECKTIEHSDPMSGVPNPADTIFVGRKE